MAYVYVQVYAVIFMRFAFPLFCLQFLYNQLEIETKLKCNFHAP